MRGDKLPSMLSMSMSTRSNFNDELPLLRTTTLKHFTSTRLLAFCLGITYPILFGKDPEAHLQALSIGDDFDLILTYLQPIYASELNRLSRRWKASQGIPMYEALRAELPTLN